MVSTPTPKAAGIFGRLGEPPSPAETDPLLGPNFAARPGPLPPWMVKRPSNMATGPWTLVLRAGGSSWLCFMVAGLLFMFCYHHLAPLVEGCVVIGVLLCLAGAALSYASAMRDQCYALLLCAGCVIAGTALGGYNYSHNVSDYWAFDGHRQYTNVFPDELADAHRDASAIVFAQGTKPDVRMATAYKLGDTSFCVAPIALKYATMVTAEVQYWAVGLDCCGDGGGGEFTCGDVDVKKARSGMVVYEKSGLFQSLHISERTYWAKAVEMASSKFGVPAAANPILLKWVQDIDDARLDYWREAWYFWGKTNLLALGSCLLLALGTPLFAPRRSELPKPPGGV